MTDYGSTFLLLAGLGWDWSEDVVKGGRYETLYAWTMTYDVMGNWCIYLSMYVGEIKKVQQSVNGSFVFAIRCEKLCPLCMPAKSYSQ